MSIFISRAMTVRSSVAARVEGVVATTLLDMSDRADFERAARWR